MRGIIKGSVVCYGKGWFRVTAKFRDSVNLGSIFGSRVIHKRVPLSEVYEDEDAWYKNWQQSETYRCM